MVVCLNLGLHKNNILFAKFHIGMNWKDQIAVLKADRGADGGGS